MTILFYGMPLGLALNIVGLLLVFHHGHALFLRAGSGELSDQEGNEAERGMARRRRLAKWGAGLLLTGLWCQLVSVLSSYVFYW